MAASPRARLIVPRRSDNGHRDRLWDLCRQYWENDGHWDIAEGEHTDGPFNRSAAINEAARGAWDVAVILDADTILDIDQIEQGIATAHTTGELVLPFTCRNLLNQRGTKEILAGYQGSWERWVTKREKVGDSYEHVSSCLCVPRRLWDEVGGFDERFEGWGGEDDAFHAACSTLAGVARIEGHAWHLWHPPAKRKDGLYRQAKALSDRYLAANTTQEMRGLLAEDRGPDQTLLICLTTGVRPTLERTILSVEEKLAGPVGRKLVCVDSLSFRRGRQVSEMCPGWDVELLGPSRGFANAVQGAVEHAIGSGQRWVFWLEDDFVFEEPVDLAALQAVMEANEGLAQVALMRQPWYPPELRAGSVVGSWPRERFEQRDGYVEHRAYWTMNPMLTSRSVLASRPWPSGRDSELLFGRKMLRNGHRAGIWGALEDPPRVKHIGEVQAGHGY